VRVEIEALEDVADRSGERLDVRPQVLVDVHLVAHQRLHIERRRVEEMDLRLAQQKRVGVDALLLALRLLGEHRRLRRLQHAIEAAEHREWQDHPAVLRLFVIAAKKIGDGPDEGRQIGVAQRTGLLCCEWDAGSLHQRSAGAGLA
jgi:hypothetical protein